MHQYVVIVFNQTLIFIIYFQMLTVTKLRETKEQNHTRFH